MFDELAAAVWRLSPAQRLEAELPAQSGDLLEQLAADQLQKKLERTFCRGMNELEPLQTNRPQPNLLFTLSEPLPGFADLKRFAKQT